MHIDKRTKHDRKGLTLQKSPEEKREQLIALMIDVAGGRRQKRRSIYE